MIKLHPIGEVNKQGTSKFCYALDLNQGYGDKHHAGFSIGINDHGDHINTATDLIGLNINQLKPESMIAIVTGNYANGKVTVKEVTRFVNGMPTQVGKSKTKRALAATLRAFDNKKLNVTTITFGGKRKKLEKLRELKENEILLALRHVK